MIDDILFVHPKDMQDGKVPVTDRDITTNLPYVPGVHLAFDHHLSETIRVEQTDNFVIDPDAKSAARVVYDHFGGAATFPNVGEDMLAAVDQADSADYTLEDILHPHGWTMVNFMMDPRTGLGRFRNFPISNYQLMMNLIEACRTMDIEGVLRIPDVQDRVNLYYEQQTVFNEQLKRVTTVRENVVTVDYRGGEVIHAGNRFMVYALFPETNVSMHVIWGKQKRNVAFAVGKSILNRTCKTNIGTLMLAFGGGGHANAGTCQIPHEDAGEVQKILVDELVNNG